MKRAAAGSRTGESSPSSSPSWMRAACFRMTCWRWCSLRLASRQCAMATRIAVMRAEIHATAPVRKAEKENWVVRMRPVKRERPRTTTAPKRPTRRVRKRAREGEDESEDESELRMRVRIIASVRVRVSEKGERIKNKK